jgi:DNA (cytosine-5)-methyltransferase 1
MGSHEPRAIDLFCGAGGNSYGAQNAGAEIVAGSYVGEPVVLTFKANFSNASIYDKDIYHLCPEEIKEAIGDTIPSPILKRPRVFETDRSFYLK